MSNSAKDTREGVMDALGNVAKGAEDLVKEVVTEVRKNSGRLLRHHPRIPFFDRFRRSCSFPRLEKKLPRAFSSKVRTSPLGVRATGRKNKTTDMRKRTVAKVRGLAHAARGRQNAESCNCMHATFPPSFISCLYVPPISSFLPLILWRTKMSIRPIE